MTSTRNIDLVPSTSERRPARAGLANSSTPSHQRASARSGPAPVTRHRSASRGPAGVGEQTKEPPPAAWLPAQGIQVQAVGQAEWPPAAAEGRAEALRPLIAGAVGIEHAPDHFRPGEPAH